MLMMTTTESDAVVLRTVENSAIAPKQNRPGSCKSLQTRMPQPANRGIVSQD